MKPSPPLSPGDRLGRFRLERFLARGDVGQVWLAQDEGALGVVRHVALKVLGHGSANLNSRLLAAARAVSGLHHPNIVQVLGVIEDDERPQIALEYIDGENLDELQRSLRFLRLRVPTSVVAEIGIAVSEALHHAWTARLRSGHPARITHGDLSPSNILVADHGVVQVTDFGGRAMEAREGAIFRGTPAYRAPEVWAGKGPGPASDLFSLGVILWELMTGERFHRGKTAEDARRTLLQRPRAEEVAAASARSGVLGAAIGRLLARDPAERPASALESAESLRAARRTLKRPADLVQFVRLVRAGRVDPGQRTESLQSMPSLPDLDLDWMRLVRAAGFTSEE